MARRRARLSARSGRSVLVARALLVVGVALAAVGLGGLAVEQGAASSYAALAREAQPAEGEGGATSAEGGTAAPGLATSDAGVDWEALRASNPDVAAWVRVEGTSIDYPVVEPDDGDASFYLGHDFWGRPSFVGCPFLDPDTSADAAHVLAYGHHLGRGGMFSELRPCFSQQAFDVLGTCWWATPQGGETRLRPLCALRVEEADEEVRRFSFLGQGAYHQWLAGVLERSTASCADAVAVAASSTRAVSLVTCASVVGRTALEDGGGLRGLGASWWPAVGEVTLR